MASLARGGETGKRIREHDWASTAIGPFELWPAQLRAAVGMIVSSDLAMALLWGRENVLLYNDAYRWNCETPEGVALGASAGAKDDGMPNFPAAILNKVHAGNAVHLGNEKTVVRRGGELTDAWFDFNYSPLFGESGEAEGVLAVMVETTERVKATEALRTSEQRIRSLMDEIQHRARNTLSVVRAIARKTAEALPESQAYAMHLDGRLEAFARAHTSVTRSSGRGLDLEAVILDELQALNADAENVHIAGPVLRLKPKAGELLTLAIHEMTTNALKFGAFASRRGHIDINWTIVDEKTPQAVLRLSWRERTSLGADHNAREGFGFELLKRTLPYELDARTDIRFEPGGLNIIVDLPFAGTVMAQE
jgi:two-component system CheB/CheR fusion protein